MREANGMHARCQRDVKKKKLCPRDNVRALTKLITVAAQEMKNAADEKPKQDGELTSGE